MARTEAERHEALYSWMTPAEMGASQYGGDVSAETVLGWIRDGELQAQDCASAGSKRPAYRIREDWAQAFARKRAVNAA